MVNRCVCFNKTFAELQALARREGLTTLDDLTRRTGCGSGCGLCQPYIAAMLQTGQTAFYTLLPQVQGKDTA